MGVTARRWAVLAAIMLLALALRARGIDFGLPALYDQDEPLFQLSALRLLREGTLNPGWFGHPGTTTIYTLALLDLAVLGAGLATERFGDVAGFGAAIYADPSVVILPGRWLMVAFALGVIALTWRLARTLFGTRVAAVAALLVAVAPLHITYSQIIRTDMQQTLFILLGMLATVRIARHGRRRDFVLAGIWLGVACATKWPSVTLAVTIMGATLLRARSAPHQRAALLRWLVVAGAVSVAALLIASPYLLLDYPTVLTNLSGETRDKHPGATGTGLLGNIAWYAGGPFLTALGPAGLAAAVAGLALATRRSAVFGWTVLPFALISFVAMSAQALVWPRWIIPLLPFAAIAAGVAVDTLVRSLPARYRLPTTVAAAVMLIAQPLATAHGNARERADDTRRRATTWARANIPPGSTVIVEQLAFDMLGNGWRFLFPLGDAGCVDVAAHLRSRIPYSTVARWRGTRANVNIGTIAPERFATCRADFAVLIDYDRYLPDRADFTQEIAVYEALIGQGRVAALIHPVAGKVGGPVVRIIALNPARADWDRAAATLARRSKQ